MPSSDHTAEGAALASLELHRALIALLVAHGIIREGIAREMLSAMSD